YRLQEGSSSLVSGDVTEASNWIYVLAFIAERKLIDTLSCPVFTLDIIVWQSIATSTEDIASFNVKVTRSNNALSGEEDVAHKVSNLVVSSLSVLVQVTPNEWINFVVSHGLSEEVIDTANSFPRRNEL